MFKKLFILVLALMLVMLLISGCTTHPITNPPTPSNSSQVSDGVLAHFGNWLAVAIWIIIFGAFLAFVPFYKKSTWKPSGAYLAFIIAFALEMFGLPFGMYVIAWATGQWLPDGILWGHTLGEYIGAWGMYLDIFFTIIGILLVVFGWKTIHKRYWSKEEGKGELVKEGIYAFIRHPQYTGFLMITFGMLCEWATLPLLLMWPVLVVLYYRLARKEEKVMESEFGQEYLEYKKRTSMFLPLKAFNRMGKTGAARKAALEG
jgi:protein-S-isoprenylcysteine O-methyltransferase Ste14